MGWSRSEEQWDKQVERPSPKDNDGARFAHQLRESLFGQSGGRQNSTRSRQDHSNDSYSIYGDDD